MMRVGVRSVGTSAKQNGWCDEHKAAGLREVSMADGRVLPPAERSPRRAGPVLLEALPAEVRRPEPRFILLLLDRMRKFAAGMVRLGERNAAAPPCRWSAGLARCMLAPTRLDG